VKQAAIRNLVEGRIRLRGLAPASPFTLIPSNEQALPIEIFKEEAPALRCMHIHPVAAIGDSIGEVYAIQYLGTVTCLLSPSIFYALLSLCHDLHAL